MRIYVIGNDGITLCREPPTALVREDGFEYEGQRYRSLTVRASGTKAGLPARRV